MTLRSMRTPALLGVVLGVLLGVTGVFGESGVAQAATTCPAGATGATGVAVPDAINERGVVAGTYAQASGYGQLGGLGFVFGYDGGSSGYLEVDVQDTSSNWDVLYDVPVSAGGVVTSLVVVPPGPVRMILTSGSAWYAALTVQTPGLTDGPVTSAVAGSCAQLDADAAQAANALHGDIWTLIGVAAALLIGGFLLLRVAP